MEQVTPTSTAVAQDMVPASALPRGRVSKFLIPEVIFGLDVGIVGGLRDIGVKPDDFDLFALGALRDAYIATNPRQVGEEDVRRICVAAH